MASLKELLDQKAELERQIEQVSAHSRSEAVAQIRALMDEHSLTAADLGGGKAKSTAKKKKPSKSTGVKIAAKYRNSSTGETWSGRGLQPKWLRAALGAGKKISDFAVTK